MMKKRASSKAFEKLSLAERREAARRISASTERTNLTLKLGDARDLSWIPSNSVHLVVTSPPYWTLKKYNEHPKQMGDIVDYDLFLDELDRVWRECFRVLVPGGRLVCVVGDVCLSRKEFGRHLVMPLHADITSRCRKLGFDNLNPIIWHKISNAKYEVEGASSFLGKPYEPNAIIKNDMEYILLQRKPGGYRSPTPEQRMRSMISKEDFNEWFRQIWTLTGASTRNHPAPYPLELANRLIRMFSFVGDVVLDPFSGTGTTILAAIEAGRSAIGSEIDPAYAALARARIEESIDLLSNTELQFVGIEEAKPSSHSLNKVRKRGKASSLPAATI